ncbi:hypothetical protein NT6N_34310 [Oceaniferula spumae]|uniref:Uncharacterized protein n=1 Tax=Oceaniferula spumae TaxID=2979115 RepID=A0AAT9FQW4_9BACT
MRNFILLKRAWLVIVMIACGNLAYAQEDTGAEGTRLFRVTSFGAWKGGELFIKRPKDVEGQSLIKVDLFDMGYSPPMRYKAAQPILFFKKAENEEIPYEEVMKVAIPNSMRQPLILLIPRGDKILSRVFDLDPSKFPYGSCQVVNFAGSDLQVAMDKDSRVLKSNQSQVFAPVREEKQAAWLRVADIDTKQTVFTTMMMRRAKKRMFVFFIDAQDSKGGKTVKTRMLVDFRPDPKKP